ncbi:MAG TPA: hypothetical protein VHS78_17490 [Candidatus Elarobacter sp.]|jgi:hypothetical protein|nr:hypothetical protein [Candidatus Elarobacter sp.]
MPSDELDDLPLSRPTRRIPLSALTIAIAVVSLVVSIGSAIDAHRAVALQSESAELDRQVALVESCTEASPQLFRVGDDFDMILDLNDEDQFWNSADPKDFNGLLPHGQRVVVRCQFTNLSRVPLLSIYVHFTLAYHHHTKVKDSHTFPFALAPNASHAVWFFNTARDRVAFVTPTYARYTMFPIAVQRRYKFEPRVRDYWVLYRDEEPDENLDDTMM